MADHSSDKDSLQRVSHSNTRLEWKLTQFAWEKIELTCPVPVGLSY